MLLPFIAALGACVGSFLNVVIFRLPEGESLVHPPSHCPRCGHGLRWWENVPVLAWCYLRGRCASCKAPISFQYPLVEAFTAVLFAGVFALDYLVHERPLWAVLGVEQTWPMLVMQLVLISALVAATLIDARLFIIPLSIPWFVAISSLVVAPVGAWLAPMGVQVQPAANEVAIAMGLGGGVGLVIAMVLTAAKLLPRSFEFTEADETAANEAEAKRSADDDASDEQANAGPGWIRQLPYGPHLAAASLVMAAVGGGALLAGLGIWPGSQRPSPVAVIGGVAAAVGLLIVSVISAACSEAAADSEASSEAVGEKSDDGGGRSSAGGGTGAVNAAGREAAEWFEHPHPRREVLKELLFVAWPVSGALAGYVYLQAFVDGMPLPLAVLGTVLFGGLIGGGVVWAVRIGGTLGFGREAMGLGDVHLMWGVGTVIGAVDATIAFFLAPFFGLAFTALLTVGVRLSQHRKAGRKSEH